MKTEEMIVCDELHKWYEDSVKKVGARSTLLAMFALFELKKQLLFYPDEKV